MVLARREVLGFLDTLLSEKDRDFPAWFLVSIYSTPKDLIMNEENVKIFEEANMKGYVSLLFEDIESPCDDLDGNPYVMFTKDHAKAIIGLLDRVKEYPGNCNLMIHCDAGISRSGAVGAFAANHLNYDFKKFKKLNPNIHPNKFVLLTLYNSLEEK